MGSISHRITPLVFNSLGGGRTHTQTYILTFADKAILGNRHAQAAWFNKMFETKF